MKKLVIDPFKTKTQKMNCRFLPFDDVIGSLENKETGPKV